MAMRALTVGVVLALVAGCSPQPAPPVDTVEAAAATPGCMKDGAGQLQAELRGALKADIDWSNAEMECDGGPRPDGDGLRVTIAGPLQEEGADPAPPGADASPRRLRFIFGIDLTDTASGPAQVLPTNLTVIVEGEGLLYTTQGSERCAVEDLVRTPLEADLEKVAARGYCLGPASDLAGEKRVLVPTFSFTALVRGTGMQVAGAR